MFGCGNNLQYFDLVAEQHTEIAKYPTAKDLAARAAAKSAAAVTAVEELEGTNTSACYHVAKSNEVDKDAAAMEVAESRPRRG